MPNGLAYVKGEPQVGQSIWIADAESKKSKVIAKDRPGQSVTGSLSASGHWLVWTYQQIQHDPVTPVDWEMSAYNLTTGETKTLASGHSPLPAIATVSGNSAVWSQYLGMKARKSTYWHIDLRTGKKTPVLKKVAAGQAAYSDRTLVYTLAEKVTRGYGKEDLFEIPIEGGEPVRLTHTGRATGPDLFGNTLSWRGRLGKWADTGTRARQLPDGPTVAIPGQSDTAASGDGFVADERNKKWRDFIQVTSLNDPTYPLKIWLPSKKSVCVPCELDAGENTVTWGEQKDDGPITAVLLTLGH